MTKRGRGPAKRQAVVDRVLLAKVALEVYIPRVG